MQAQIVAHAPAIACKTEEVDSGWQVGWAKSLLHVHVHIIHHHSAAQGQTG